MIVYPIVFVLSVGVAGWSHWQSKTRDGGIERPRRYSGGAFVVFIILASVSALRWDVGADYRAYDQNFDSYVTELPESFALTGEPGIRFLAWLSDIFNAGSAGMFALAAFITVGLVVRTIWRWSIAFAFSVAVHILSGDWHGSFNGVRQYLAAAILLAGHRYIVERNFFKWILVVLLATLFHVSALVGVLMYFIPRKRLSILSQLFFIAMAVLLMFGTSYLLGFIEVTSQDVQLRGNEYAERSVNPLRIAFQCVPLILYWILPARNHIESKGDWFYANMLLIVAVVSIAGSGSAYLTRFEIYPSLFLPIGLALITSMENKREQAVVRGVLLVLMAAFIYVEISASEDLNNFQWIFNRA